jgi:hypothetical protein
MENRFRPIVETVWCAAHVAKRYGLRLLFLGKPDVG